jgi:quercetin dioxygenase-like cupin family protein
MSTYRLRLLRDQLPAGRTVHLPAHHRVLYVLDGAVAVTGAGAAQQVASGAAVYSAAAGQLRAERDSALLRYELVGAAGAEGAGGDGAVTRLVLEQAVELDPTAAWLMRCDRVDFAPGTVALPHGHRGGGIRCLIAGALTVQVGDHPPRTFAPGGAWYESGQEPVRADASPTEPTSFVRVSILPREIRGQSSIWYVDPASARVTPRSYTVFVDEPIELA